MPPRMARLSASVPPDTKTARLPWGACTADKSASRQRVICFSASMAGTYRAEGLKYPSVMQVYAAWAASGQTLVVALLSR